MGTYEGVPEGEMDVEMQTIEMKEANTISKGEEGTEATEEEAPSLPFSACIPSLAVKR